MTAGRFKNGRYQQGIGTPDTLGVQPTSWSEPKPPALRQASFTSANSGSSRNYGSTPDYVDGFNSRWKVSTNHGTFLDTVSNTSKAYNAKRKANAFDEESASRLGISTDELRARRTAGADLSRFDRDADVFARTSAAGWTP